MSGIGAIFNFDGRPVGRSEVERMRNVLHQYGPDRQRTLVTADAGLVACLHYLTPEDQLEQQPMASAGEAHLTLFDGRLDNRDEVAAALGIAVSHVVTLPDGALVHRAWERWGNDAFQRMVGAFAVIIVDRAKREIVLVRDQFGMRVLYYHRSLNSIAVATCPEALFALSWVPRELNMPKLGALLVQEPYDPEESEYLGIQRVRGGTILTAKVNRIDRQEFWRPELAPQVRYRRDEEYVEAFNEQLERAVARSLRATRAPCTELTGGLDSSSIAVIAADQLRGSGQPMRAFTAVPEETFFRQETPFRYFDETPFVRSIAALNGNITPSFVRPKSGRLVDQIAELTRVIGAPVSVLNGLWGIDIVKAVRAAGGNVLLSGQMGNDTMSYGGTRLAAQLLASGRLWRLAVEIALCPIRRERMIRREVIAPFVPPGIYGLYKRWRRGGHPAWAAYSAINPELADVASQHTRRFGSARDAPPVRDSRKDRIIALRRFDGGADWYARIRAAFGVDIRTPALDRNLVEFCLGVPEDQYLRNGRRRWLIRRAMAGRLPPEVLANHKIGTQAADWFARFTKERASLREEIDRLDGRPGVGDLLHQEKLLGIVDGWPEVEPGQSSPEALLQSVALPDGLSAGLFLERFYRTNVVASNRVAQPIEKQQETTPGISATDE